MVLSYEHEFEGIFILSFIFFLVLYFKKIWASSRTKMESAENLSLYFVCANTEGAAIHLVPIVLANKKIGELVLLHSVSRFLPLCDVQHRCANIWRRDHSHHAHQSIR